ncbi:MAG TPA: hypothetical protein PKW15_02415, partial [Alphaproteobacteria bacterium]|nr:hypothetical protein [Alphaproteobacteria bacterium]
MLTGSPSPENSSDQTSCHDGSAALAGEQSIIKASKNTDSELNGDFCMIIPVRCYLDSIIMAISA